MTQELETNAASGAALATYQSRVAEWMMTCFGADILNSRKERAFRFAEEAGELCQTQGLTMEEWTRIGEYVWGRPVGEASQEVGGAMVTLAALCHADGLDFVASAETELARIDTPETIDKIRRKHLAKSLRTPHSVPPGLSGFATGEHSI